ncbi:MAG TPA: RES family NAD+ phosphorylase [Geminicoccaceae bacterium]|nr:RES family NAD+ phosphorylase [Geminicoccaceae bacterium]
MRQPRISRLAQRDTHRLIPSKFGESVLTRIADDDAHLRDIFDLDNATNERLLAENDLLPGIGIRELVFDVPHYRIVNAAFCHAHPLGSRFAGPDRGAWYAGFELATAQAEVAFHKTVALAEIGHFHDSVTYDDYLADFTGAFHDLRDDRAFADCLAPDSYLASQKLAAALLEAGSPGIVYPSVRRPAGTNLACFRPALVGNVRRGETYQFTWRGAPEPAIEVAPEGSGASKAAGVLPAARRARRSASDSRP